jgi:hypothetical protein
MALLATEQGAVCESTYSTRCSAIGRGVRRCRTRESAGGSALTRAAALPLLIQIEQSFDVVIDACEIGKRELRREQELHSNPIDRLHL